MNRIPERSGGGSGAKAARSRDTDRLRGPRSERAARLRQYADLSRFDRALSDRAGLSRSARRATPTAPRERRPPSRWRSRGASLSGRGRDGAVPSGLAAISIALLACLKSGDHLLVPDSVYRPTRNFCDTMLQALRRRDDLLRSAARRRHRAAVQAAIRARCSPRRRARCRSRCRTFRRSPRSRMRATRSC